MTLLDYFRDKLAGGEYCFTVEEAVKETGMSRRSLISSLSYMKKKGHIFSPAKGLYVIIPPNNANIKCLPEEDLVPLLMDYWGLPYYVCLLSAARYHGASHQSPMVFQVMTTKQIKPLTIDKTRIQFLYKNSLDHIPVITHTSRTGYLKISSPEITAIDLVTHIKQSGGLSHIATVLSELIEAIDPKKMIEVAELIGNISAIQRMGYILSVLDPMDEEQCALILKHLKRYLETKKCHYIPLHPQIKVKGYKRDGVWKVIVNSDIESDV